MTEETLRRGDATSQSILNAANRLFTRQGFHGTSMREIAAEAGLAVGGIYNHYANKEEIFKAVVLAHHPFFHMLPAMQEAEGDRVEDFVRDAAKRMVATLNDQEDFLNLMFIELVEFKGIHIPQLFELFFPQVLAFAQRFLFPSSKLRDIPVHVLMRTFMGLFFSYFMMEAMIGKNVDNAQFNSSLEDYVDIYLYGILSRD